MQNNPEARKGMSKLMIPEENLRVSRLIRRVNAHETMIISFLKVNLQNGTEKVIESMDEMEDAQHGHSNTHFMQPVTNNIPFVTSPLLCYRGIWAERGEANEYSMNEKQKYST